MSARVDLGQLKARFDIREIVERYVKLERRGRDYWCQCPFHDDRTPSFKLDPRRQDGHCFGCGWHGDLIAFVAKAEGISTGAAIRRLQDMLGETPPDPKAEARREARRAAAAARETAKAEANRELAQEIWRQANPMWQCVRNDPCPSDHPGKVYLESRGLWICPETLYFHPACPFGETTAPAILAPVNSHRTGLVEAVWRIRLNAHGQKVVRYGLGPMKGNASRLYWSPGPDLAIAEGVEDAIAVHKRHGLPAWAALSASNMPELILPRHYTRVLIFADHDADGGGLKAAHKLARRLQDEGRTVHVLRPTNHKDPNDVLLAGEAA
jgi:DNA primase